MKGNLFSETILYGNQTVSLSNYIRLGIDCELVIEIGEDFGNNTNEITLSDCYKKVVALYSAFELIDDRNADYSNLSLISANAENSWNANSILSERQTKF